MPDNALIWVEISRSALKHNLGVFRKLVGPKVRLAPVVKSNAYGHGILETGKILRDAGADYLAVNALFEARKLRKSGDIGPIYICGYTALADLQEAVELNCELVIYNRETLLQLGKIVKSLPPPPPPKGMVTARVHLKVETGVHRQGVPASEAVSFADEIRQTPGVELAGVSMHFANIEDTTNHSYAWAQLAEFGNICTALEKAGHKNLLRHAANSAATLLWDSTHFEFARPGVAVYGMWPSDETFTSFAMERKEKIVLKPALTWKTKIAQIKKIPAGAKVGYGCTWAAPRETKLAILPVGYYDGYVRAYSGRAAVLIHGQRAPVVGRVCMNICMVDVTDIPAVRLEDEVVLLGQPAPLPDSTGQVEDKISAEEMGTWSETINYEVTTRIREEIERRVVE